MSTLVVVCFDVADPHRLYRVAREMGNFGVRVQKSVFECHLTDQQLAELQRRLAGYIDATEDHVRYYRLCGKDVSMIAIDGPGRVSFDPDFVVV